jgi:hypothetical protein
MAKDYFGINIPKADLVNADTNFRALIEYQENKLYELCQKYGELAKQTAQNVQGMAQGEGYYWINRSRDAVLNLKGFAVKEGNKIGWGLAHTMEYGVYLEQANNGSHSILGRTVRMLRWDFLDEARDIFNGKS